MEKITSFTIDHLRLVPGLYVSRIDQVDGRPITTFDIRMTNPNEGPVMNTAEVHTIEHLGATFLRNHETYADKTIYFGPMGCRTGFYLLTAGLDYEEVYNLLKSSLELALEFTEVPGNKREECGNYLEHDLSGAIDECKNYLRILKDND